MHRIYVNKNRASVKNNQTTKTRSAMDRKKKKTYLTRRRPTAGVDRRRGGGGLGLRRGEREWTRRTRSLSNSVMSSAAEMRRGWTAEIAAMGVSLGGEWVGGRVDGNGGTGRRWSDFSFSQFMFYFLSNDFFLNNFLPPIQCVWLQYI
jgi:hypothetical protein